MLKYIIALVVFFAALEIFSIFVAAEFIGGLFALYVVIVEIFVKMAQNQRKSTL